MDESQHGIGKTIKRYGIDESNGDMMLDVVIDNDGNPTWFYIMEWAWDKGQHDGRLMQRAEFSVEGALDIMNAVAGVVKE